MDKLLEIFIDVALATVTSVTVDQAAIDIASDRALRKLEEIEVVELTDDTEWGTGIFRFDWVYGEVFHTVPWDQAPEAACHEDPASVGMEWAAGWFDRTTWNVWVNCTVERTPYDLESVMFHEYWHWAQHAKIQMYLDDGVYTVPELNSHATGIAFFMDSDYGNDCFAAMEGVAYFNDSMTYPSQTHFIGWDGDDFETWGEELGRMIVCEEGSEDKRMPYDGEINPITGVDNS